MESLSAQEVASIRGSCPPEFAGWVYVSSLATKTYKKTPLVRRWCEVRKEESGSPKNNQMVLEFYRTMADVEPTKRVHLSLARVVISRSSKLTHAQVAQMPPDSQRMAFYIDFPDGKAVETRRSTTGHNLGFVLVASDCVSGWESVLVAGCRRSVPKERRRQMVQRWINRAWLRVKGNWEGEFDEVLADKQEFFSLVPPNKQRALPVTRLRFSVDTAGSGEEDEEEDDDGESFVTATSSSEDLNDVTKLDDEALGHRYSGEFSSIEEMFAEKSEEIRHGTRICEAELNSVVEFVLGTRIFSTKPPPEWSLCSSEDSFDCFKSIDSSTGIFRTRTWAKLAGIAPQTLFHILYDKDARRAWDHHYCKFDSVWVDPMDPLLDILDACVSAPFGCANREFLEWRRAKRAATIDAPFVIYLRSWDAPGRPVAKGAVRAEVWLSGYVILPWMEGARLKGAQVLVFTQIDIKGLIPKYVVNALSSSAPKKWVRGVTAAAQAEMVERGIGSEQILGMSHQARNAMYML